MLLPHCFISWPFFVHLIEHTLKTDRRMIDDDGSIESEEIKSIKLDQAKKQRQFVLNNGHGALPIGSFPPLSFVL